MKRIVLFASLIVLVFACSSEDGENGATGPQGSQGEQGLAGEDGENGEQGAQGEFGQDGEDGADGQNGTDGTQGETGTANVIYSDWFPSQFPDDIAGTNYVFVIDTPELTEEILATGVVLVYSRRINISSGIPVLRQLPITLYESTQQHYYNQISIDDNIGISFVVRSIDDSPIGSTPYDSFRYVIIPGGIPSEGKSSLDYTKMTYEEVAAHFEIED